MNPASPTPAGSNPNSTDFVPCIKPGSSTLGTLNNGTIPLSATSCWNYKILSTIKLFWMEKSTFTVGYYNKSTLPVALHDSSLTTGLRWWSSTFSMWCHSQKTSIHEHMQFSICCLHINSDISSLFVTPTSILGPKPIGSTLAMSSLDTKEQCIDSETVLTLDPTNLGLRWKILVHDQCPTRTTEFGTCSSAKTGTTTSSFVSEFRKVRKLIRDRNWSGQLVQLPVPTLRVSSSTLDHSKDSMLQLSSISGTIQIKSSATN